MMASCRDLLDLYLEGKKIGSSEYGDFATGMVKSISPLGLYGITRKEKLIWYSGCCRLTFFAAWPAALTAVMPTRALREPIFF